MTELLKDFWNEEEGLEVVEVILILGILIGVAMMFQDALTHWWNILEGKILKAVNGFNI